MPDVREAMFCFLKLVIIIKYCLFNFYKGSSYWAPVVSGVLGPLLFSLHINDITADLESEIRLCADDCLLS